MLFYLVAVLVDNPWRPCAVRQLIQITRGNMQIRMAWWSTTWFLESEPTSFWLDREGPNEVTHSLCLPMKLNCQKSGNQWTLTENGAIHQPKGSLGGEAVNWAEWSAPICLVDVWCISKSRAKSVSLLVKVKTSELTAGQSISFRPRRFELSALTARWSKKARHSSRPSAN